jgi:hypothetical protein
MAVANICLAISLLFQPAADAVAAAAGDLLAFNPAWSKLIESSVAAAGSVNVSFVSELDASSTVATNVPLAVSTAISSGEDLHSNHRRLQNHRVHHHLHHQPSLQVSHFVPSSTSCVSACSVAAAPPLFHVCHLSQPFSVVVVYSYLIFFPASLRFFLTTIMYCIFAGDSKSRNTDHHTHHTSPYATLQPYFSPTLIQTLPSRSMWAYSPLALLRRPWWLAAAHCEPNR